MVQNSVHVVTKEMYLNKGLTYYTDVAAVSGRSRVTWVRRSGPFYTRQKQGGNELLRGSFREMRHTSWATLHIAGIQIRNLMGNITSRPLRVRRIPTHSCLVIFQGIKCLFAMVSKHCY